MVMEAFSYALPYPAVLGSSEFSIYSVNFRDRYRDQPSAWVRSTFGSDSIWYNESINNFFVRNSLSYEELIRRNITSQGYFATSLPILSTNCAVEMLGYVQLGTASPFLFESIHSGPSFGSASLEISSDSSHQSKRRFRHKPFSIKLSCVYRALYENWRQEPRWLRSYWTTVFLCPCSDSFKSFAHLLTAESRSRLLPESLKMTTVISLRNKSYKLVFDVVKTAPTTFSKVEKFAVCTSVPYISSERSKILVNKAMLVEWIRYYQLLDFRVMLYDRGAANLEFINSKQISLANIQYYNYTVKDLLDQRFEKGIMEYDNAEKRSEVDDDATILSNVMLRSWKERFLSQGYDKVKTFSLCRFEASAKFHISKVLVVDFDEFIYCPGGKPTAASQKQYLQNLLRNLAQSGFDQVSFTQWIPHNRSQGYETVNDCAASMVEKGDSIFNCFAATSHQLAGHSFKSFHLTHTCLLTGYHQACPFDSLPRTYNCQCKSIAIHPEQCLMLHLSTQQSIYDSDIKSLRDNKEYEPDKIREIERSVSELQLLMSS